MLNGKVYLVGAGPGAPDLLTLRAAEVLRRADIVFYDALVHPDTLALAAEAECIAVGKRCGGRSTAQRFINKRLIDAAHKYRCVVRLKGGDPMLFGRAQEEIKALSDAGIEYEIVPGITAALAASSALAVSLTRRGVSRSVAFLTPRIAEGEESSSWARAAMAADTTVIYMGVGEAAMISRTLSQQGIPSSKPVVIVESASLEDCRMFRLTLRDLARIEHLGIKGPAIILMGEVYAGVCAQALECSRQARYA